MKTRSIFTGILDLDLSIAEQLDDVSVIRFLIAIPGLYTTKNIALIFGKRYPDLISYREEGESVMALYLRMLHHIGLLKERFNFIYGSGNPEIQYYILDKYGKNKRDLILQSVEKGELDLVKYAVEKGATVSAAYRLAMRKGYKDISDYLNCYLAIQPDHNADFEGEEANLEFGKDYWK